MKWISANQAAELLGVTRRTIYEWAKSGKLPAYRVGTRMLRFNLEELETWQKEKEPNA